MTEPSGGAPRAATADRVVVVTGGGTGIGRAVAAAFARSGASVVITGRRPEVLEATAGELGPQVTSCPADVSQPAEVRQLGAYVRDRFGRVDVLVNNAGYLLPVTVADPEAGVAALEEVLQVNVVGAYLVTAALADLLPRPGGRVINISSIAALTGGSGAGAAQGYAAAKAGLIGLTFGMARELGPQGVTVNAVAPGFVADTGFTEGFSPARVEQLVGLTVVGRAGEVDDVAAAVSYLASPEAGWVCGQVLHVNGGSLFGR
jgi:3-oxoacyl-[acyl-carrier protein] reductase